MHGIRSKAADLPSSGLLLAAPDVITALALSSQGHGGPATVHAVVAPTDTPTPVSVVLPTGFGSRHQMASRRDSG